MVKCCATCESWAHPIFRVEEVDGKLSYSPVHYGSCERIDDNEENTDTAWIESSDPNAVLRTYPAFVCPMWKEAQG